MPLKRSVPEFCKERDLSPTTLHLTAGISYANAWEMFHGKVPGGITLEKLCNTFKRQPTEFVVWEEG